MSRIEKGSQRFRPTVVSRRPVHSTTGSGASKSQVSAVPSASGATQTASTTAAVETPAVRSYAFAPPAPRKNHTQGNEPSQNASKTVDKQQNDSVASASRSVAPRTTSLVKPVRAASVPIRRPIRIPGSNNAGEIGVSRAEQDPTLMRIDPALANDAMELQTSETLSTSKLGESRNISSVNMNDSSAEPRRPGRQSGGRRTATSISDDEAEYNEQCAAVTQAADSSTDANALPPLRVDVGATTMESIAVTNWKSGRVSSRTFDLERVRQRQLKKRRKDSEPMKHDRDKSPTPDVIKESGTPVPTTDDLPQEPSEEQSESEKYRESRFAVQTRIVDGKIVLDERSLYANYRDEEQQAHEQRNWEVVDEREGDQFVNSASRSKQRRTQRWSEEETERFFHAVSQWGTDFEIITRLFPQRTRREIKSKWSKESRQNPKRLDDAFTRRTAVDLKAYGHVAGVDLSGPPPTIQAKSSSDQEAQGVQDVHQDYDATSHK
ncbi:hypothetical protein MYAM1_001224 [Malassezia yamatoensis]|uniref:Myb-like domain-containing protein n=1 Tax=Malassezia yamatoensis TaxID=253288 RepID=A0AAJ5YTI6_9BASI|nr:hypothetical protein MYAM1_001224 [Malassezia yamatoensis]